MQTYARVNKLPLDVMMFVTEVTTKTVEQVTEPAALGSYIHGLVLEGARYADGLCMYLQQCLSSVFYQWYTCHTQQMLAETLLATVLLSLCRRCDVSLLVQYNSRSQSCVGTVWVDGYPSLQVLLHAVVGLRLCVCGMWLHVKLDSCQHTCCLYLQVGQGRGCAEGLPAK